MNKLENFTPQATADGSFTFFSQEFNEAFHSHFGAKQESFFKFVSPTQLAIAAQKPVLRLLDICYGLGYNTAAALETIWAANPNCQIELFGLELNLSVPQAAIEHKLFDNWNYEYIDILTKLAWEQQVQSDRLNAKLLIGDARNAIRQLHQLGFQADAIFLDPFSPPQCPQLWTVEFIQQVVMCLDADGLLATYSCAAAVRTALLTAGLDIGSTPPVGRRSPGTVAAHPINAPDFSRDLENPSPNLSPTRREALIFPPSLVGKGVRGLGFALAFPHNVKSQINTQLYTNSALPPLSPAEKEHLFTRAAIPYRDPQLNDEADVIVQRRQKEQQASSLEPTSRWRKRCLS